MLKEIKAGAGARVHYKINSGDHGERLCERLGQCVVYENQSLREFALELAQLQYSLQTLNLCLTSEDGFFV